MENPMTLTVLDLARVYARYFVEDFAANVLGHLEGSYKVDPETMTSVITQRVDAALEQGAEFGFNDHNSVARFVYECAEHVLEKGWRDPESRDVWSEVANLPSIHHPEIGELMEGHAKLYRDTIETTLLEVVVNDAETAAKTIITSAENRISNEETGGTLTTFNWGILQDGLWVNGALLRAREIAKIFNPDTPVVQYYATTAFTFAKQKATTPMLNDDRLMEAYGTTNHFVTKMTGTDPEETNLIDEEEIKALCFRPGYLYNQVVNWEFGLSKPDQMIKHVVRLSILARAFEALSREVARREDDMMHSDHALTAIARVYDVISLALAGFEALRLTKFKDAVILAIATHGEDPTVEVFVNSDLVQVWKSSGNEIEDLVSFGVYLDPRKGIPFPSAGYDLGFLLGRRERILSDVLVTRSDRLEKLRNNDAQVIREIALRVLNEVVTSYTAAAQKTLSTPLRQRLEEIAFRAPSKGVSFDLSLEIARLLISIIGDPILSRVSETMFSNMALPDEEARTQATARTILHSAVEDGFTFFA